MSWKRYFKAVGAPLSPPMPSTSNDRGGAGTSSKFSSYLPEVYAGHPNRIQRYYQYDDMDRDSDINAALDTISDFCTQSEEQNKEPFEIYYTGEPNETEVKILKTALSKWMKLNDFRSRLWHMFRSTLKNGDAFFLRDPETAEWLWIDTFMVEMVKVDESAGKEPDEYIIRGLDYNKQAKFATLAVDPSQYRSPLGASNAAGARPQVIPSQAPGAFSLAGQAIDPRARDYMSGIMNQLVVVDAQHVVHLSLSVGMDINWPFGASILEPVFKTYKQKELLEDSVIIYRVQRAPERRIFYIDTGTMPPVRAKAHIEQVKNEIHQRRIPNRSGGGACLDMATEVPLLDGRTLSIESLAAEFAAGKENWAYSVNPQSGEIVPGKITWAGKTRLDAKVVRLTLDNGETMIVTPDHNFPIVGRGKVQAKDIVVNVDSLISFNKRLFMIDERNREGHQSNDLTSPQYEQVYDHSSKTWRFTHRIVANYLKQLCYDRFTVSTLEGLIRHFEFDGWYDLIKEHGRRMKKPTLGIKVDHQLMSKLVSIVSEYPNDNIVTISHILSKDNEFMSLFNNVNLDTKGILNKNMISQETLKNIVKRGGFDHWTDFKNKLPLFNHKVVSIEYLDEKRDVGTLTIDGKEELHDFHTFATKSGIFTYNSILDAAYSPLGMLEDYFFASSSDGRGSKVETLPGGEMTGEIGDLLFFSKKLARGLRIPTSYLPLGGEEEGSATFNDGKLGAALIQEFRFNKYCMRIQALLAPKFDKDFKWYLRKSGIEIDEDLFELQFLPPQNFTKYRQIEVDAQQVQVYSQLAENKKLSERFKLKRFLNLTDDELLENEKLWSEENASKLKKTSGTTPAETPSQDLSSVGLRSGGGDFMGGEPEMPEGGEEGGDMGAEAPAGGAGAAPAPSGGIPGGAPPAGGGGMGGGAPPAG